MIGSFLNHVIIQARQGTVEGLRSALMNIGRHDSVQVLNQATYKEGDENRTQISARNVRYFTSKTKSDVNNTIFFQARDSTSHPICVM